MANLAVFGNFGGRYIETETICSGLVKNAPEPGLVNSYSAISLTGKYNNFLPSLNINVA